MKNYSIYIALFSLMVFNACSKDNKSQSVPQIKLISVSTIEITEFTDSLSIQIEYTDEDGDIGETNPDKNALYIKDRRLSEPDYYFVKPLSPPGSGVKIIGTINVKMKNTFLLGTGNSEPTQFDIKLKDQAGHWSNTVSTPVITINKKQ
jgi:hypothetical protein